jgi:hypothetical protein
MIGRALRAEVEAYAVAMRRTNPLFTRAEDGTLTADCLARYLANVHFIVSLTPPFLARARARALELGDGALAAHFAQKSGEEVGHDAWAARDLERVSAQAAGRVPRGVLPAMRELTDYLMQLIDTDPALYLSYILFTEQLIVALGPDWLRMLESRCGIPRTSMTVIANHAELDRHHVEEALAEIDDLVGEPKKLPLMRQALQTSIAHFERFCVQVTCTETTDGALVATARSVSAA